MKEYYLYLIWQDPNSRRNFIIGKLTRGEKYKFEYMPEAEEARKEGWHELNAFPKVEEYFSDIVFPIFSSRLPDRKRRDINEILKKYSLQSYDEFELLRKSGAQLPIDTYHFIDPIFPKDQHIEKDFYVAGIRYHAKCKHGNCEQLQLSVGDRLTLIPEPDNLHDKNAIYLADAKGGKIGYVPRYYNRAVLDRFEKKETYSCVVIEVNQNHICSECVKVRLKMPIL